MDNYPIQYDVSWVSTLPLVKRFTAGVALLVTYSMPSMTVCCSIRAFLPVSCNTRPVNRNMSECNRSKYTLGCRSSPCRDLTTTSYYEHGSSQPQTCRTCQFPRLLTSRRILPSPPWGPTHTKFWPASLRVISELLDKSSPDPTLPMTWQLD